MPTLSAKVPDETARPDLLAGPDFILIGAMKCATSTLSAYLEGHSEVFMVRGQDPDYFSKPEQWARGPDWYSALFADAAPGQIRGEGSNSYTWDALYPGTAGRLIAACPRVKLVFLVRDPIARIVSHWVQVRADQGDAVPARLVEAIREQPDRLVAPSLYWRQLSHYRTHVPDNRIWIGFMEDLEVGRVDVLRDLCRFLDIAPESLEAPIHRNPSAGKEIPGALYSRLRAMPWARAMAGYFPHSLKDWIRTEVLSQPIQKASRLDDATRADLVELLYDDSRAFLTHCGKSPDFWPSFAP